eukprot:scaffold412_cov388-Prasinococcus_capsulatus_cf.AAC.8
MDRDCHVGARRSLGALAKGRPGRVRRAARQRDGRGARSASRRARWALPPRVRCKTWCDGGGSHTFTSPGSSLEGNVGAAHGNSTLPPPHPRVFPRLGLYLIYVRHLSPLIFGGPT